MSTTLRTILTEANRAGRTVVTNADEWDARDLLNGMLDRDADDEVQSVDRECNVAEDADGTWVVTMLDARGYEDGRDRFTILSAEQGATARAAW